MRRASATGGEQENLRRTEEFSESAYTLRVQVYPSPIKGSQEVCGFVDLS